VVVEKNGPITERFFLQPLYQTYTLFLRWILPCLAGAHDVFQHPVNVRQISVSNRSRSVKD
jgi:hypothetical protein